MAAEERREFDSGKLFHAKNLTAGYQAGPTIASHAGNLTNKKYSRVVAGVLPYKAE